MNEIFFLLQIFFCLGFLWIALKLGKAALISYGSLQAVLANLFVLKQINLFSLSVTPSDPFAVGSILSLNLLQEFFGKKAAQKSIWISFFSLAFFALCSQVQIFYLPNAFDSTSISYEKILLPSLRICLASFAAFFITQQLDLRLFPRLRGSLRRRIFFSLLLSQLLDTILFTLLGLWGSVESLLSIILVSFTLKCVAILCSASCINFTKKAVKDVVSL